MLKPFKSFPNSGLNLTVFMRSFSKRFLDADPLPAVDCQVYEYPMKSSHKTNAYGWGLGDHGALGHYIQKKKKMRNRNDSRFKTFRRPFRLMFGEQHNIVDMAAGFGFSAFSIKSNNQNKVFGTGLNTDSQIGIHCVRHENPLEILLSPVPIFLNFKEPTKTEVIALSAGRAHLVIITDREGVFTLGNNSYGQCGRVIVKDEKFFGSTVVNKIPAFSQSKVINVECGQDHTLFLTENGEVYACGWGADGQTGLGHYNNESSPKQVQGDIEGEKIIKISSRSDCVLAINDKGEVFGWGNSEYSQLFGKNESFQQINRPIHLKKCQGYGKIIDVASAGSFCMMLNEEGDVFSWGYGILGRGPNVTHSWSPDIIPPVLFGKNEFRPDSKVKSIYCGLNYSGAITNHGDVYTWGKNKNHCLGLIKENDQFFPLKVYIAAYAKKLFLGVDHSLALCHPN